MNRLTEKDEQGNWCLKGVAWENLHEGSVITKEIRERIYGALCKLKDYEDTGLSPNDVEVLNDFERSQIGELLKALGVEQCKHRLIPVKEKLPETEDMVLIQVSGHPAENISLHDALQLAEYNPEEGWILEMWPKWEGAEPVAWMPLPKLYTGD